MPAAVRGVGAALLALVALAAAPASAHTDLVSSRPADAAVLTAPPAQVSARFGDPVLEAGAQLAAQDAAGAAVELGPVRARDDRVLARWPQGTPPGRYTVSYRVAGTDGHPLQGSFSFRIRAAETADTPRASPAAQPEPDSGQAGPNYIQIALLVVALAAAGYFVWRSRAV
jgi:methionine-rich copper-binding protein CopC